MTATLKIFFSGTNYDHNNLDELIAKQFKSYRDGAYLFAGPGSEALSRHQHRYAERLDSQTVEHTSSGWLSNFPNPFYRLSGLLGGSGMDFNVKELESILKAHEEKDDLPDQLDLCGWSRGAVTAIRASHMLQKKHPEIKVNLFLVDPVPGTGNFTDQSSEIPSNVNSVYTVYMKDEERVIMKPILPRLAQGVPKETAKAIMLDGAHSSGVERDFSHPLSYAIVNTLLKDFLDYDAQELERLSADSMRTFSQSSEGSMPWVRPLADSERELSLGVGKVNRVVPHSALRERATNQAQTSCLSWFTRGHARVSPEPSLSKSLDSSTPTAHSN